MGPPSPEPKEEGRTDSWVLGLWRMPAPIPRVQKVSETICSPVSGVSFLEPFLNSWELGIEAGGLMDEEWGSSKASISLVSDLD